MRAQITLPLRRRPFVYTLLSFRSRNFGGLDYAGHRLRRWTANLSYVGIRSRDCEEIYILEEFEIASKDLSNN